MMRYFELFAFANALNHHQQLRLCKRVAKNDLLLVFENESWLVLLSDRLIAPFEGGTGSEPFNAAFDQLIAARLNNAQLITVAIDPHDKILRLEFCKQASYKEVVSTLVIELVPHKADICILDENGVVIESLRRSKPLRQPYEPPPKPPKPPVIKPIENIKAHLQTAYTALQNDRLETQKAVIIRGIDTKLAKFHALLHAIGDAEQMIKNASAAQTEGELLLAHIGAVTPFSTSCEVSDFAGRVRVITLSGKRTAAQEAQLKFAQSKRLKAKAAGVGREQQNIGERIDFFTRLKAAVQAAKTAGELLTPPREKASAKLPKEPIEAFVINGKKVLIGRNDRCNALLLKRAKATDMWLHQKDLPSAHTLITGGKENLPLDTIMQAALICARFSLTAKGDYLVDYTVRRNVKIVSGAQVTYTHYKTVSVRLE